MRGCAWPAIAASSGGGGLTKRQAAGLGGEQDPPGRSARLGAYPQRPRPEPDLALLRPRQLQAGGQPRHAQRDAAVAVQEGPQVTGRAVACMHKGM